MLGQVIEYYIEKIFMEKFGCSKANFGQQTVLLTWCYSLYFILYETKIPESLGMRLGSKAWPSMKLGFEPRIFGSGVEAIV